MWHHYSEIIPFKINNGVVTRNTDLKELHQVLRLTITVLLL